MINAKGETIYTNAEIGYELGLSAATINAVGKRLYGMRIPHWTLGDARRICEYIKSISIEEDTKRLARLHDVVVEVMGEDSELDDEDTRKRVKNDIRE